VHSDVTAPTCDERRRQKRSVVGTTRQLRPTADATRCRSTLKRTTHTLMSQTVVTTTIRATTIRRPTLRP